MSVVPVAEKLSLVPHPVLDEVTNCLKKSLLLKPISHPTYFTARSARPSSLARSSQRLSEGPCAQQCSYEKPGGGSKHVKYLGLGEERSQIS